MYIKRLIKTRFVQILKSGKSIMLLGPRQTGKTTFLGQFECDLFISLIKPRDRLTYEKDPQVLEDEIRAYIKSYKLKNQFSTVPLVIVDEIQLVPQLLDIIQFLIDEKLAQFILTGSSARKLRKQSSVNLLPGRVVLLYMSPFSIQEIRQHPSIESLLQHGSLPDVFLSENPLKEDLLQTYLTLYLEEEIRQEASVRDIGKFAKFLEMAALESGNVINFSKISQDIGVSYKVIQNYFEILDDCLIIEKIPPLIISSTRKKLTKSDKYLFFDLGLRNMAAGETGVLSQDRKGRLFEQFIGLELIKLIKLNSQKMKLLFWRDPNGPEVDWILELNKSYRPIEVKLTASPTEKDARHIIAFQKEYPTPDLGYIVCNIPRARLISDTVMAISWKDLPLVLSGT